MEEERPIQEEQGPSQAQQEFEKLAAARGKKGLPKNTLIAIIAFVVATVVIALFSLWYFSNPANTDENLIIVYALPLTSLDPLDLDVSSKDVLQNVYEPLVRFDKDMNLQSGLALSWGNIDDLTWEFKLRPNVTFHDGSAFDADDVVFSFNHVLTHRESIACACLLSVDRVEKMDPLRVRVYTKFLDPNLARNATALYISQEEDQNDVNGTGPYIYKSKRGNNYFLEVNENYWGDQPFFPELNIRIIRNAFDRLTALLNNEIDVLGNVPPLLIQEIPSSDFTVTSIPGLDTTFLLLNSVNSQFSEKELRQAVNLMLDPKGVEESLEGIGSPATQFVSPNIFGYNDDIKMRELNENRAKNLKRVVESFYRIDVMMDFPEGAEGIFDYIARETKPIDIVFEGIERTDGEFNEIFNDATFESILFSWRADTGDSLNFLINLVHTATADGRFGNLNSGFYSNPSIDRKIERVTETFDLKQRGRLLREIMTDLVEDQYAIPLYHSDVIYSFSNSLMIPRRVDGAIMASQIELNVVK